MTVALRRADAKDSSFIFQLVNREDSLAGKLSHAEICRKYPTRFAGLASFEVGH